MASMAKQTTKSYHYSSSGGGRGDANVTIEYSADMSSLHRLEVRNDELGVNLIVLETLNYFSKSA
jgi:hypothetical protein